MTVESFIDLVEKYYGKYENAYRRELIKEYVADNFNDADLPKLFTQVTEIFSAQYKTQPDISVMCEAKEKYNSVHGEWIHYMNGKREYIGDGIGITRPIRKDVGKELDDLSAALASKKVNQIGGPA